MVTRHLKQWRSLTISSDLAATLPQPLALIAAMQRSAFWSIGCIWLRSARRSAKCAMIFLASRNPSPCCSLKCHMSVVGGLAWRCQSAKFPHGRSPDDLRTSHPHHYRDQRSSCCKPLLCALRVLLRRLWNTPGPAAWPCLEHSLCFELVSPVIRRHSEIEQMECIMLDVNKALFGWHHSIHLYGLPLRCLNARFGSYNNCHTLLTCASHLSFPWPEAICRPWKKWKAVEIGSDGDSDNWIPNFFQTLLKRIMTFLRSPGLGMIQRGVALRARNFGWSK